MARHGNETHEDTIQLIKEGKKNQEIVELLGIPLPTVKSRRMRYKEQLKGEGLDSNPFETRQPKTSLAGPSQSDHVCFLRSLDWGRTIQNFINIG